MIQNKLFPVFFGLFLAATAAAQPHLLVANGETGKLYVDHVVEAKENWYSVGRLYNISPKEIAPFNSATLAKPLEIGEHVKVPLTAGNFSQNGLKAGGETLVPVYHIIQPKEWMFHISTLYNKVPIENLEKWNHITRDQAKAGMQLIVGYLRVKTAQSALALPANNPAVATTASSTAVVPDNKAAVVAPPKEEKKSEPAAVKTNPVALPTETKTENKPVSVSSPAVSSSLPGAGFFGTEYLQDSKQLSGQAGTFKSTSGWQDGKYYALMNNVPVGTIVKVTSPSTNKTIFAKVLGQLPDMKESAGLSIRISNAAASTLGSGEGKFPVEVKY